MTHINGLHIPVGMIYEDIAVLLDMYGFKYNIELNVCTTFISLIRENVEILIWTKDKIQIYEDKINLPRGFNNIYSVYTYLNNAYPQWRKDIPFKSAYVIDEKHVAEK